MPKEIIVSIFAANALGFGVGPLLSGAIGVSQMQASSTSHEMLDTERGYVYLKGSI